MQIIKRDGKKVDFDKNKIVNAILKAFLDIDQEFCDKTIANKIANEIESKIKASKKSYSVEDIQNAVEEYLMRTDRTDVAKSYIRYRYKREIARNCEKDFINAIKEKLDAKNIQNQNANIDESSFGGRIGEASSVVNKKMALDFLMSPMAKSNHLNNEIYIHN